MQSRDPPLVAHVIYRLDVGGLENGLVNLVNRMPADRYRHAIICLAGYSKLFRGRILRADTPVMSVDKRSGKDPAAYFRMWRTLRRLRPDVVHTRNLGTVDMQWVASLARVRARVHGEHGWDAADAHGANPRNLRIRRACRPVVDRYVAMSRDIERWLRDSVGVPESHIRQLYNGVDSARFAPAGPRPADCPWAGADPAPIVIGTLGRLDAVKDQATLLRAFQLLLQRSPLDGGLRLVVAGAGPMEASLRSLAAELGLQSCVWFAGAREDTADLLRSLDVYVLPSINEGISNTILEAMATGLPVVASRVGGNPELVDEGRTGRLFQAGDAAALSAILGEYVLDAALRRDHGASGRRRVVQTFSLDAMVDRYLALYDELLANG